MSISSSNDAGSLAKADDTVTLTITASEDIQSPTCALTGVAGTVTVAGSGTDWTCTVDVASGDTAGAVGFTIDGADLAGNALVQVTAVTDGSSVTYDD